MRIRLFAFAMVFPFLTNAQEIYFPPTNGDDWETISPQELGWCEDQIEPLINFLDDQDSKAFILLKDGKIVVEHYFDQFTTDSLWYWASAGKSLKAFMMGQAQEQGYLDIEDAVSDYLMPGWTSLNPEQESEITIWNQLTMTSGLQDDVPDLDCWDPECLTYLAEPGTRWSYHNAPYTLINPVFESATNTTINLWVFNEITPITGINGAFVPLGYNSLFISTPRSMARFGLLCQNHGAWGETAVLQDESFFVDMVSPSQTINPAYGYLWWLNGQESFMVPQSQIVFPGPLQSNAPEDTYAAMGKNGQLINVSESEGIVWIRMGNSGDDFLVPSLMSNDIWEYINAVACNDLNIAEAEKKELLIYPNPASEKVHVIAEANHQIRITSADGRTMLEKTITVSNQVFDISHLPAGSYVLHALSPERILKSEHLLKL